MKQKNLFMKTEQAFLKIVALERFELPQAEPESDVLPLHHKAIFYVLTIAALKGSLSFYGCKVRDDLRSVQVFQQLFSQKFNSPLSFNHLHVAFDNAALGVTHEEYYLVALRSGGQLGLDALHGVGIIEPRQIQIAVDLLDLADSI